ncbi:uncharacterized protein LOC126281257 [Schistocerca gregaria]|uniref:uncharacterized protein LOC126281257 n=1 Tax=Schistocerca gregaria TaxID=7010 RepID=UPI00211DEA37|nr:uncharacterized protein LOC126281257 [Schistocerca gregaria]
MEQTPTPLSVTDADCRSCWSPVPTRHPLADGDAETTTQCRLCQCSLLALITHPLTILPLTRTPRTLRRVPGRLPTKRMGAQSAQRCAIAQRLLGKVPAGPKNGRHVPPLARAQGGD